jgi:hypothetical protein
MPWSRKSRWKLMMLVATLWIVFWRCSDRLDQPQRRAELVLHVGRGLVAVLGALVEQPAVDRADAQLRQPFLVEDGHVLLLDLHHVDVRDARTATVTGCSGCPAWDRAAGCSRCAASARRWRCRASWPALESGGFWSRRMYSVTMRSATAMRSCSSGAPVTRTVPSCSSSDSCRSRAATPIGIRDSGSA